jgi:hypothetical protein
LSVLVIGRVVALSRFFSMSLWISLEGISGLVGACQQFSASRSKTLLMGKGCGWNVDSISDWVYELWSFIRVCGA